jgi:hypothetical protein
LLNVGEIIQNEKKIKIVVLTNWENLVERLKNGKRTSCSQSLLDVGCMIEIRKKNYYFHKLLEVDGMVER